MRTRQEQKRFLEFRRNRYRENPIYVDNNYFMIKEVFAKKTCFLEDKTVYVFNVEEDGVVLCQGMVVHAKKLPEYIQLCFFESKPDCEKAVERLVEEAIRLGREHGCKTLVIGLNGHVNYGLGFLDSHFEQKNSFSAGINPPYYNTYFREMGCQEVFLNTYKIHFVDKQLERYMRMIQKMDKAYTFRQFDKRQFDYYAKIYTDLNNRCFGAHRYYYNRTYEEDREMLKELFLFMKEDSLIFAFKGDTPIGFLMWYPDFNELVKQGEIFGARHFFRRLFRGNRYDTAKVMEFGVLEQYRMLGIPLALLHQVSVRLGKYGITKGETSWILEENTDSNRVCQAVCDETYKRYVVYEKPISEWD